MTLEEAIAEVAPLLREDVPEDVTFCEVRVAALREIYEAAAKYLDLCD